MHHSMRTLTLSALAAFVFLALAPPASAQTPGRLLLNGAPSIAGNVIAVSPQSIEMENMRGEQQKVSIEQVRELTFNGEPQSLKAARVAIMKGDPSQALDDLTKIDPTELEGADQLILDEMAFAKAAAIGGKSALTGVDLAGGEKAVREYLAKHGQSHHAFRLQELLAGILSQAGKYADAATALGPLEKGPPAYQVRAAAALAEMLFAQQKYDEAAKQFTTAAAIPTDAKDAASTRQKQRAELGAAKCLVRQGKAAAAVSAVQGLLEAADPEGNDVFGMAYNVLGHAYRSEGKDQDALIAFLTVDLVHNKVGEDRAEALFNLVQLWDKNRFPERAGAARQTLESAYPDSPWTRKLGASKGS